jgi:hypothetical protein
MRLFSGAADRLQPAVPADKSLQIDFAFMHWRKCHHRSHVYASHQGCVITNAMGLSLFDKSICLKVFRSIQEMSSLNSVNFDSEANPVPTTARSAMKNAQTFMLLLRSRVQLRCGRE